MNTSIFEVLYFFFFFFRIQKRGQLRIGNSRPGQLWQILQLAATVLVKVCNIFFTSVK
jgi:hypothetical protein